MKNQPVKPPLLIKFQEEVLPKLSAEFGYKNSMAVPRLVKIVVNIGLGEALNDKKIMDEAAKQLAQITGQKPRETVSKRAISTFKLRAGQAIGLKVTLRKQRMYIFLQKLITIVLPRVRDFRGISKKGFDKSGNYSLGFSEQNVFPEIDFSQAGKSGGLEITIVTSAKNNKEAYRLLELLGLPFAKGEQNG